MTTHGWVVAGATDRGSCHDTDKSVRYAPVMLGVKVSGTRLGLTCNLPGKAERDALLTTVTGAGWRPGGVYPSWTPTTLAGNRRLTGELFCYVLPDRPA